MHRLLLGLTVAAQQRIGPERFVHTAPGWAVLHDPEGYNVLLLERKPQ